MTSASARLASALAVWPLDHEQRSLIKEATARINKDQAHAILALLREAESAVTSCANFLMGNTQPDQISHPSSHEATGNIVKPPKKMARHDKNLNDLFLGTLKDIYYAEKQILKVLPKMTTAAHSGQVRAAFEKHHRETEGHVERLERIFELIDRPVRGKTCPAIQGLLDEVKEIMEEYKGTEPLDAGMLAAAQAVEHYEIARYGTLKQWAQQLGIKEAVALLDETLQEEKKMDRALADISLEEVWSKEARSA
jgi:ferritin-like metal-binding protein YciE